MKGLVNPLGPWAGMPGAVSSADQLVIRDSTGVPEPGALRLVSAGILAMSGWMRLRKVRWLQKKGLSIS